MSIHSPKEQHVSKISRRTVIILSVILCALSTIYIRNNLHQEQVGALSTFTVATPPGTIGLVAWFENRLIVQITPPNHRTFFESRLWSVSLDGSQVSQLTLPSRPECEAHRTAYEAPIRLPDQRLGYILRCGVKQDPFSRLYMMAYDFRDGTSTLLHRLPLPSQHVGTGGYSWNPEMTRGITSDGTRFVGEQLYWFTPDATIPTELSFPSAMMAEWSPDGKHIAFVAVPKGLINGSAGLEAKANLYRMTVKDKSLHTLVTNIYVPGGVVWSPNSRWIIVGGTIGLFNSRRGLWLVEVVSGRKILLIEGDYSVADWSPDGKYIVSELYEENTRKQQIVIIDASLLRD